MLSRIGFKSVWCKPVYNLTIAKMSNMPTFEHLKLTTPKEYVFHVQLNRPDKRNALNYKMFGEIKQCFQSLSDNEECRVVVLSGTGNLFCAGLDLKDTMQNMFPQAAAVEDPGRKAKVFLHFIQEYQKSMSSLELCRKPVLAAVHNACIGAGVDMVTAACIRFCTKDAYFQVKEVDIGMAADIGTLQRLPKVIRSDSLVRELCYTSRQMPADEASHCGLVSKVYDNQEEMLQGVIGLAEQISKKSPVAVQGTKQNLVYSRDHTVQEGLDHIALINQLMLQSEDLVTATQAQLMKDPDVVFSKL